MAASAQNAKSDEDRLADEVASFYSDPLGFVYYAWDWGDPNHELEHEQPDDWQIEYLDRLGKEVKLRQDAGPQALLEAIQMAVASGHGVGKQVALETIVPTPQGNRRWGDIKAGDLVFGVDGSPTKVVACHYPGVKRFYRVKFDDGSVVEACAEHQWAVRGRQERRKGLPGWRTMTTEEILAAGVKRPNGKAQARQWEIPVQGAAQFDPRPVKLHPYFVGVWLGDGSKGQPSYCKPSPEVKARVADVLGLDVRTAADQKQQWIKGIRHLMTDPVFSCYSQERYIPDDYKFNTVEVRTELFRGLCDTDGEVHSHTGTIGYSTTSQRLAEDVLWLARSLGCKASMQPTIKEPFYTTPDGQRHPGRDCYRLTINCPFNPFTHAEKAARFKPSERRYQVRWIDSIERIEDQAGMCITVEAEDELYLANDFVVTHNTCLVAWVIYWFLSTRNRPQIIVTANTKTQLQSKTWREVAKWHRWAVNRDWFNMTATKIYLKGRQDTDYAECVPWTKEKSESFQGGHDQSILLVFDEASAIDDVIWEAASGSMSTHGAMWLCFGNPTRATGRFRDCFGRFRHRWIQFHVDSRDARKANKAQSQAWIEDYGIDDDYVRVRVLGQFPRKDTNILIDPTTVELAQGRKWEDDDEAARIMAVDVARYGDNQTVIGVRQGKIFRILKKMRNKDADQVAAVIWEYLEQDCPDAVYIDAAGGWGAPVVDKLILRGAESFCPIVGVNGAHKALNEERYNNRRTEMWVKMRDWLVEWGSIEIDTQLRDDLQRPTYSYDKADRMRLETKDDMKRRGEASPDNADCLSMTFYEPVAKRVAASAMRTQMDLELGAGSWMSA